MGFRQYLEANQDRLFERGSRKKSALDLLEAKYQDGDDPLALRAGEILVEAESLEKAFDLAAQKLGSDISKLTYRILEQGGRGMLGLSAKPFRIAFSLRGGRKRGENLPEIGNPGEETFDVKVPVDRDGKVELKVTRDGKFLVLTPPVGSGSPVAESAVVDLLAKNNLPAMEGALIKALLKRKDGKPFKMGEWRPNYKNDGKVFLEMTDDRMKASVRILPPKADGRQIDEEDIRQILGENRIIEGVLHDRIRSALEKGLFNIPVLVAEGRPAIQGKDATLDFKVTFRDKSTPIVFDDNDDVDFADLGLIVNVMADEVLVEKVPPTQGVPGVNLLGQVIPARDGKDVELKGGENTVLSSDGSLLKAKVNGHAVMEGGLISVKPVFLVNGDVGPSTGHITNMGSVIVNGKVLDGFNIKAGGNIDVKGTVGNCLLEATGDITIKLGAAGRNGGKLIAQGNVASKYLEQIAVKAGGNVVSTEEIMNCTIEAGGSVLVGGKKAVIRGGRTCALEEVRARIIGSPGNVKTIIEVGVPPEIRSGMTTLLARIAEMEPLLPPLQLDISTMKTQMLDDEKGKELAAMEAKLEGYKKQIEEDKNHVAQLEEIIAQSPVTGQISWAKMLYRGSVLVCNSATLEVGRDNGTPTTATVDEMARDRVKFTPLKIVKDARGGRGTP